MKKISFRAMRSVSTKNVCWWKRQIYSAFNLTWCRSASCIATNPFLTPSSAMLFSRERFVEGKACYACGHFQVSSLSPQRQLTTPIKYTPVDNFYWRQFQTWSLIAPAIFSGVRFVCCEQRHFSASSN